MKIKKSIYHGIFFDVFFGLVSILLVTFGFFLGFDITKNNIIIYVSIIMGIAFLGVVVLGLYALFCKTYYEFTNDSIKITKKGSVVKEISYDKIKSCEYYKFVTLFLGDSKGGNLVICYLEEDLEKSLEISFSKKHINKLKHISINVR